MLVFFVFFADRVYGNHRAQPRHMAGSQLRPLIRPWYLMWLMEVADSGGGEVDSGGGNRCSHEGSQLHAGISIGKHGKDVRRRLITST